jgi:polysaccharide biosynthesis/export protein
MRGHMAAYGIRGVVVLLVILSCAGCALNRGSLFGFMNGDESKPLASEAGAATLMAPKPADPAPTPNAPATEPQPVDVKIASPAPAIAESKVPRRTALASPPAVGGGAVSFGLPTLEQNDFRIGKDDELEISVYANADLTKTTVVRPDGMIAFPLVGDVQAHGLRPDDLRAELAKRLAKFVRDPLVTVMVTKYRSRKVNVLGEVKEPGLFHFGADITLLEALARAGGVTEAADLRSAVVVRAGRVAPVDFDALLRQADFSQNVVVQSDDVILVPNIDAKKVFVLGEVARPLVIPLRPELRLIESLSRAGGVTGEADLQGALLLRGGRPLAVSFEKLLKGEAGDNVLMEPNDVILIPNLRDKKIFVLGEVNRPLAMALRPGTTIVESISTAGGFTRDAQPRSVVVVRGGLGDPELMTVNVKAIAADGEAERNVMLQPGDIVYVPKSLVANVVKFFQDVSSILAPLVLAETGIVLGPAVKSVLQGTSGAAQTQPTLSINAR